MTTLASLRSEVAALRVDVLEAEHARTEVIAAVDPAYRASAINLIHYVEMRGHDLRDLQIALSKYGLSSFGRMEAGVLRNLDAVLDTMSRAIGDFEYDGIDDLSELSGAPLTTMERALDDNTDRLLGPAPADRDARIMVTMPSEARDDPALIGSMLAAGMDVVRINTAHDAPDAWASMIVHLRSVEGPATSRHRVAMDLAGPKLRTGPIEPGPEVVKVRPTRDALGHVVMASKVWFGSGGASVPSGFGPVSAEIGLRTVTPREGEGGLVVGDAIHLIDARGSRRTLTVVEVSERGFCAAAVKTIYFVPGLELLVKPAEADRGPRIVGVVGPLPARPQAIVVRPGDTIVLKPTTTPTPAAPIEAGVFEIGCTLPQALRDAAVGDHVWFDDGKIGGVIVETTGANVRVRIDAAGLVGAKLRAEKGINLPDTHINLGAITDEDAACLPFIAEHADIVEASFVRSSADVADLLARLAALESGIPRVKHLGVVLKIETVSAFRALPQMLLEAMRWPSVGVMIARGDLAVETGFERLAEVQEEILWLCESAHIPVIWATQVLDSLASTGLASRAEVTDAAMGERAECVMLNKGPFITDAIAMLDDILRRMRGHFDKKRSLLRRLRSWESLSAGD